jgi:hypothetical protein
MIRPDDIDFIPHPEGDVVVVGRQFLGAEHLYRLRLTSGARVHSVQPATTLYPVGARVRVVANLLHVSRFRWWRARRAGRDDAGQAGDAPRRAVARPAGA